MVLLEQRDRVARRVGAATGRGSRSCHGALLERFGGASENARCRDSKRHRQCKVPSVSVRLQPDSSISCAATRAAPRHAPRLRDAAARRVGRFGVEDLADRCRCPRRTGARGIASSSCRAPTRIADAPAATRRRSGRSAMATPCPGGTPRRASAGLRGSSAVSGCPARACAGRTASGAARCTTSITGCQRRSSRTGRQRDREDLVRPDAGVVAAGPSTTSNR